MAISYVGFPNDGKRKNQAKKSMDLVLGKVGKANKYLNDLKNAFPKNQLGAFPKGFENNYIKWFGVLNENRINRVASQVHELFKQLTKGTLSVHYLGKECERDDFAYTEDANNGSLNNASLHLCQQFFTAPILGMNSQTGTLIHELTHIVFNTDDHAYGYKKDPDDPEKKTCIDLAKENPAKAIDNADNYEYFIESFPDK